MTELICRYGYGNNGPQWGGERIFWNLSHVGGSINIDARLEGPDGQSVTCRGNNCPTNQAYATDGDHQAVKNSGLGGTYTHVFCP